MKPSCGEPRAADIGIERERTESAGSGVFSVTREDVRLPRRRRDAHKGDFGRCLIVAGSVGYTGAPALCARAATRTGAGLVYLGVPRAIYGVLAAKCGEEMPFPLPCDGEGRLSADAADEVLRRASECDALLIGPGLGRSAGLTELVTAVLRTVKAPVVLDADGINAICEDTGVLDGAAGTVVLTPHPGEFKRLSGGTPIDDRLGAARDFARAHRCVVVLKGHGTVSAFPDGTAYINTTGGPAMAKGGSGDVLAGMTAALLCQKFSVKDAVVNAVYIHGGAGDLCAEEYGEYSVTAGDIIAMLPRAIKDITE